MRAKTLMMTVSLALLFLATPQTARAQEDGEAQFVMFDEKNNPVLKFSNKGADAQDCGLWVGYTLTDKQEEAFVLRVVHLHFRFVGGASFHEKGLLYITPSRITFVVQQGDQSHAFDAVRTDLSDKPVTIGEKRGGIGKGLRTTAVNFTALQINLKEKLPASDSREQKFGLPMFGYKKDKCDVGDAGPYTKFLARTVNDFDGALAEFKQLAAWLKQAGKVQSASQPASPPGVGFKVP